MSCGNADARLEFSVFGFQHLHGSQSLEPGSNRTLAMVLIGAGPPEIRHDAIAHIAGDVAPITDHSRGDPILVAAKYLPDVLGIELPG